MAELLGDSQGTPRTGQNSSTFPLQSVPEGSSQNGQPGSCCGQRDGEPRLGAMREILEIDDLLHNLHDMELLDSIRWMDGREFKKRNRFFTQLIS